MFRTIVMGIISKKLKEPTTYVGLLLALGTALHVQFSASQMTDFQNLAVLIVGAVFVYISEHKPPTADQLKSIIDAGAKAAKDSIQPAAKAAVALSLLLPLLGGCSLLGNNGAWLTVQAKAGGVFCGKDYDQSDLESRKLCLGFVIVAGGEAAKDRVTHGDTADAPFVSGFISANASDLDSIEAATNATFFNADEFNYERKLGAAALRVVKREVSFIQLASAGITTGVAAAAGGSPLLAASAAGGGWLLPDFIGQPAVLAADYAGKVLAIQVDAARIIAQVKTGTLKTDEAWAALKKRNADNKAAVDALTKAQ